MQDWRPAQPGAVGVGSAATRRATHRFAVGDLRAWSQIPGLEDASGVGTYTARFSARRRSGQVDGRRISTSATSGGDYGVTVNGKRLSVDQLGRVLDLGSVLRRGSNEVRVEVATTLLNRLRLTRPALFASQRQ